MCVCVPRLSTIRIFSRVRSPRRDPLDACRARPPLEWGLWDAGRPNAYGRRALRAGTCQRRWMLRRGPARKLLTMRGSRWRWPPRERAGALGRFQPAAGLPTVCVCGGPQSAQEAPLEPALAAAPYCFCVRTAVRRACVCVCGGTSPPDMHPAALVEHVFAFARLCRGHVASYLGVFCGACRVCPVLEQCQQLIFACTEEGGIGGLRPAYARPPHVDASNSMCTSARILCSLPGWNTRRSLKCVLVAADFAVRGQQTAGGLLRFQGPSTNP